MTPEARRAYEDGTLDAVLLIAVDPEHSRGSIYGRKFTVRIEWDTPENPRWRTAVDRLVARAHTRRRDH